MRYSPHGTTDAPGRPSAKTSESPDQQRGSDSDPSSTQPKTERLSRSDQRRRKRPSGQRTSDDNGFGSRERVPAVLGLRPSVLPCPPLYGNRGAVLV